jgi:nucleotide-binding universal stress UspA family protein
VVAPQTIELDPGLETYARIEHLREPGPQLALAAADNMLARGRIEAAAKGVARISAEAREGDPTEEIIRAAAARKVDMIVVGSRGLGRLGGLLLGSVAQKVVTHAPCPVLVAR